LLGKFIDPPEYFEFNTVGCTKQNALTGVD
jgi:hypothetical protein